MINKTYNGREHSVYPFRSVYSLIICRQPKLGGGGVSTAFMIEIHDSENNTQRENAKIKQTILAFIIL